MAARTKTFMHWIAGSDGGASSPATLGVHSESYYSVQDTSTDGPTTIYDGPCVLVGVYVNTALNANTVVLKDSSTSVVTIPASSAAGTSILYPSIRFESSLVIDPHDSSTGSLTVAYRPL